MAEQQQKSVGGIRQVKFLRWVCCFTRTRRNDNAQEPGGLEIQLYVASTAFLVDQLQKPKPDADGRC